MTNFYYYSTKTACTVFFSVLCFFIFFQKLLLLLIDLNWKPLASPDFAPLHFIMLGGAIRELRTIGSITRQTHFPATLLGKMSIVHSEFKFWRDVTADTLIGPVAIRTSNNVFAIFDATVYTLYNNVAKMPPMVITACGQNEERVYVGVMQRFE